MACRICGCNEVALEVRAKEMMIPTWEEFSYFECANCHCMQIREIPENLSEYYGDSYYSYLERGDEGLDVPVTDMSPILDVGSGAGLFLKNLRKIGYGNLTGCDPFLPEDISYGENIHIYRKSIHEMEGRYSQIFFNDSFEHVTDPHEVFDSIRKLLKSNGVCVIKIPVYPNIAFDMFGADWYQMDAPRHIFLHSGDSMAYLAQAHGLRIVEIEYDSNPSQIIRSYLNSMNIPFWEQKMKTAVELLGQDEIDEIKKMSAEANEKGLGDHAVFYLEPAV